MKTCYNMIAIDNLSEIKIIVFCEEHRMHENNITELFQNVFVTALYNLYCMHRRSIRGANENIYLYCIISATQRGHSKTTE